MKKFFFTIILFACALFAYSQKSICGVDFGSSYESAKFILESKFGKAEIDENNEICYFNREYAGFNFYAIYFHFQSDGYNSYLNKCFLTNKFKDVDLAKHFEKMILVELSQKYNNIESHIDNNGYLCAQGGTSPVSNDDYGFQVFITKDDKTKEYMVYLSYGSYNYVNENF